MHSPFDSVASEAEFPDALQAISKVLDGLSDLAGIEGFDSLVQKIDDAYQECELLLAQHIRIQDGLHSPSSQSPLV